MNAIRSSLIGIERGWERLDSVARRQADPKPASSQELAADIIEVMLAKHQVKASIRTLEAADGLERESIDLLG